MFSRWGKSEVCVRERDRERGGGGEQGQGYIRESHGPTITKSVVCWSSGSWC